MLGSSKWSLPHTFPTKTLYAHHLHTCHKHLLIKQSVPVPCYLSTVFSNASSLPPFICETNNRQNYSFLYLNFVVLDNKLERFWTVWY
jgi:hypothetical protein